MAQLVDHPVVTLRPSAASPFAPPEGAPLSFCRPGARARRLGRVSVHRMRLNSVLFLSREAGKDGPAPACYSYSCPSCSLTADVGLTARQAADFGYRLRVTAVMNDAQMVFPEIPGHQPNMPVLRWLLSESLSSDVSDAGYFFPQAPAEEPYLRALLRDGLPPQYFDEVGRRISSEEFKRLAELFAIPILTQTQYEHGGFHVVVSHPPEESRPRRKVVRGRDSRGHFYVVDGVRVRDEDLRAGRLREDSEAVFTHPDPAVVKEADTLFTLLPSLRQPVAEFAAQTQQALMAVLYRLRSGPANAAGAAFELRDEVMGRLVTLLKDVVIPAAADWEGRRRRLLAMTPLGRAALALQDAKAESAAAAAPETAATPEETLDFVEAAGGDEFAAAAAAMDRQIEEALLIPNLGVMTRSQADRVAEFHARQLTGSGGPPFEDVRCKHDGEHSDDRALFGGFVFKDLPLSNVTSAGLQLSHDPDARPSYVNAAGPVEPAETLVSAVATRLTRTISLRK